MLKAVGTLVSAEEVVLQGSEGLGKGNVVLCRLPVDVIVDGDRGEIVVLLVV